MLLGRSQPAPSMGLGALLLLCAHLMGYGLGAVLTKRIVARAGHRAVIPCPGLSDNSAPGGYIINKLSWRCHGRKGCPVADEKGRLVDYEARTARIHGKGSRLDLDRASWSLVIAPVEAADSGHYSCSFNSQADRHVKLAVLGEWAAPARAAWSTTRPGPRGIHGKGSRLDLDRASWSLVIAPVEAADSGHYSCSFNSQADRHVKLAVLDVPSRPGRPVVIKHLSRRVELSWAPSFQTNNSPIEHYLIQTRLGEAGRWPSLEAAQQTSGAESSANVSGLAPFTVYTFRVVSINGLGHSPPSEPSYPVMTLRERPGEAPTLTYARNQSSESLEVGWQPPSRASLHGEFTGYRLSHRRAEPGHRLGPVTSIELRDVTAKTYLIERLEAYTRYKITLQVKNPDGLGPPASITAVTDEGVPSRPENVTFSDVSDRSLTVTWIPPRRPRGLLLGHTVYWAAQGGPTGSHRLTSPDLRVFTVEQLEPDQEYRVWLKAFTRVGEGNSSLPVRTRTDVSGPSAPVITDISCPSDTVIHLRWRRPDIFYGTVDLYHVLYRHGERWDFVHRMVPMKSDQIHNSINLPNLTSGEIYEVRIQGVTLSRLTRNKIHKGQQSVSRKVRLEPGCAEIQPFSTWTQRGRHALAAAELAGILAGCLGVMVIVIVTVLWR
ncbi:protein sidekick-2-like [Pollicipes pollicipes]|uniref:protein sidekick-2-like n=1 Tax=Pollicipes pollicipes TaxID=41117 RepID=UPI0018851315|nr:protein sidekick-2-like [Pollicipes pollicipes]